MPIYHARRFVPVSTSLDRDVLRALEHLQLALDAHGAECAIRRELPFSGIVPTQITLSLSLPGRTIREIRLRVTADERPAKSASNPPPFTFLLPSATWAYAPFILCSGKTARKIPLLTSCT